MNPLKDISVAVLAAGKSIRFGSRKELALWRGKPLIHWATGLAEKLSNTVLFIGPEEINPSDSIPSYSDLFPGNGPLGGIQAALHYSAAEYTAILPVDMPLMIPEVYHILRRHCHPLHPAAAVSDTGLEPLISIWPRSSLAYITEQLKKGKNGPIPVLDALNARRVPVYEMLKPYNPDIFININTRDQLEKIRGSL